MVTAAVLLACYNFHWDSAISPTEACPGAYRVGDFVSGGGTLFFGVYDSQLSGAERQSYLTDAKAMAKADGTHDLLADLGIVPPCVHGIYVREGLDPTTAIATGAILPFLLLCLGGFIALGGRREPIDQRP